MNVCVCSLIFIPLNLCVGVRQRGTLCVNEKKKEKRKSL